MIEVNKKAKPFHPCESLLGAELFIKCRVCSMFGRNYYDPTHPSPNKDILVVLKPSTSFTGNNKLLEKEGWKGKLSVPSLNMCYQYAKQQGDSTLHIFIAPNMGLYGSLMGAQEMCKYLQSLTPNTPLDKLLVMEIHDLMVHNKTVKLGADGYFEQLLVPAPEEDHHPQVPVAGGHNHWHPAVNTFQIQPGENINPNAGQQAMMAQEANAQQQNVVADGFAGVIEAFFGGNNNNA